MKMKIETNKENVVESGERKTHALQRRLEEAESQLSQKENELRNLSKKVKGLEESEAHAKLTIETFTKQAKETYRKYEEYLGTCEESISFLSKTVGASWELLNRVMESIALQMSFNVGEFWTQSVSQNEAIAVEKAMERLGKSHNLAKKNLFKDGAKYWVGPHIQPNSVQKRMDALINTLINEAKTAKVEMKQIVQAPPVPVQVEKPKEEIKDDATDFKGILKAYAFVKDALSVNSLKPVNQETIANLLNKASEVNDLLEKQAMAWGGFSEGEDFLKTKIMLEALIKADLSKLAELREKNNQLAILERHISSLTAENEEMFKDLQIKEFSMLEQNAAIMALEKSLQKIETQLQLKTKAYKEKKEKSEEMNQKVAEEMKKLLGLIIRC